MTAVGIGEDALGRDTTYTYDTADRLTGVVDVIGLECATRAYGFDVRGNRTSQTSAVFTDAGCTAAGSSVTKSWSHDTADRVQHGATIAGTPGGAYLYDQLGRQLTVPAVDTVTGVDGGDVLIGYYDTDAVHTLTRGDVQSVFTLDAAGRRATETTTGTSGTETLVRHYGDGSDNPTWAEAAIDGETTTSWYGASLGGDLALTLTTVADSSPVVEVTLADPQGSIASTVTLTGDGPTFGATGVYDEYGNTVTTASSTSVIDYGWLGNKERATNPATGLVLMGARLYNPTTGLFTSVDPVPGGNTTAYTYPHDPINKMDLDGKAWEWWKKHGATVLGGIKLGLSIASVMGCGPCAAVGVAWTAYDMYSNRRSGWRVAEAATGFLPGGLGVVARGMKAYKFSRHLRFRKAGNYRVARQYRRQGVVWQTRQHTWVRRADRGSLYGESAKYGFESHGRYSGRNR